MSRPTFLDEGASPIDRFLIRVGPDSTAREIELAWLAHSKSNGTRNFLEEWRCKDPTVANAIIAFLLALPRATGVAWVVTSDFRNSPSHKDGGAVDVAPRPSDWNRYAAARNIDPLLNGRAAVHNHMHEAFRFVKPPASRALTAFIEDDHVHLHLHRGRGLDVVSWPHRTHPSYLSCPGDDNCRRDPSRFKPRFA